MIDSATTKKYLLNLRSMVYHPYSKMKKTLRLMLDKLLQKLPYCTENLTDFQI